MKVIISVVNPEHLKLPVFAGIVMEQFRLGAGAGVVDEQKIAQDIHSSRRLNDVADSAIPPELIFPTASGTKSKCILHKHGLHCIRFRKARRTRRR